MYTVYCILTVYSKPIWIAQFHWIRWSRLSSLINNKIGELSVIRTKMKLMQIFQFKWPFFRSNSLYIRTGNVKSTNTNHHMNDKHVLWQKAWFVDLSQQQSYESSCICQTQSKRYDKECFPKCSQVCCWKTCKRRQLLLHKLCMTKTTPPCTWSHYYSLLILYSVPNSNKPICTVLQVSRAVILQNYELWKRRTSFNLKLCILHEEWKIEIEIENYEQHIELYAESGFIINCWFRWILAKKWSVQSEPLVDKQIYSIKI